MNRDAGRLAHRDAIPDVDRNGIPDLVVLAGFIGLSRAHETTMGKSALAVFLPVIACCGLSLLFGVMFGTMGALFGHHQ